jgi:hypothetical protein
MLLGEMLQPKTKQNKTAIVKFIRILRDGSFLYENIKTKTMYYKKSKDSNIFYNMKAQQVDNINFIEV